MPKKLEDDQYDAAIWMNAEDWVLHYNLPSARHKNVDKCLSPESQRFVYFVYAETEAVVEVLDRLIEFTKPHEIYITIPMIKAVIRKILRSIQDGAPESESERLHWEYVKGPHEPTPHQIAEGHVALLKRIGHETRTDKAGKGFFVRCTLQPEHTSTYARKTKHLIFDAEEQAFIFNAVMFELLTSEDTRRAYVNWKRKHETTLRKSNVRQIIRYIQYQQRIAPSGSDEAKHWNYVSQLREDLLAEIRRHAPAKNVVQEVPERAEAKNPYQGQSSSTGPLALAMPATPYTNEPQTSAPSQQHYQTNWNPQLPQPAAQPRQSRTLDPDPKPSQTTALSQKRPATHTLDSGSSDLRSSSLSSNSSNDNRRRDVERHGSTSARSRHQSSEEEEARRQADLKSMDDDHHAISQSAWKAGYAEGGTPEAHKTVEDIQPQLEEIRKTKHEFWDVKRGTRDKKRLLEQEKRNQESSGRGGQREHHDTERSGRGGEDRVRRERDREDRGQGERTNAPTGENELDLAWQPGPMLQTIANLRERNRGQLASGIVQRIPDTTVPSSSRPVNRPSALAGQWTIKEPSMAQSEASSRQASWQPSQLENPVEPQPPVSSRKQRHVPRYDLDDSPLPVPGSRRRDRADTSGRGRSDSPAREPSPTSQEKNYRQRDRPTDTQSRASSTSDTLDRLNMAEDARQSAFEEEKLNRYMKALDEAGGNLKDADFERALRDGGGLDNEHMTEASKDINRMKAEDKEKREKHAGKMQKLKQSHESKRRR